jgi:hypothetical protein
VTLAPLRHLRSSLNKVMKAYEVMRMFSPITRRSFAGREPIRTTRKLHVIKEGKLQRPPRQTCALKLMSTRSGSILEPAFGSFEIKDYSPSHDACSTARDFLDRVRNSAVTIRSQ